MTPEQKARKDIDHLLSSAGWAVQNRDEINLGACLGVAVREYPTNIGPVDYALFVDRKAIGVIEAKPAGTTLSGVAVQSEGYGHNFPDTVQHYILPLPFAYESTGVETFFRDERDPEFRSRRVFAFHKPETLMEWVNEDETLRARLQHLPTLITDGLRDCQIESVTNLDQSFKDARPRALIQMATGSGKTFTAVTFVYRLIKFAKARRVLFLVDRRTLGRQTRGEFAQYFTPDDGRKFTELYNVQLLSSNVIDPVSKVCITTIQRLFSMLKGNEFDAEIDEMSLDDVTDDQVKEVSYNPQIPIETFDFLVTDECHRSIYNQWRQVLEYFDAFMIGLTATPSKQTFGFFNQNLVMEYNHERAVADRVNVGYEVYRIRTKITEKGSKVDTGHIVDLRDKQTREVRWEQLDEDLDYNGNKLDRDVVAPDQIRTVIKAFKEKIKTEIFPDRDEVPKTLVFAKSDSHAEDIVNIIREEFGKGNEFCQKITYRTSGSKPEDLIASFRNSFNPRIAVTVDMISTGTDIKPLECLLFMRDVKSRVYFEQMKGRGTRVISTTDLKAVTPDVDHKTHFVIVDAVGVTESCKTDSRTLERKKTVPFEKLVDSIAIGKRDEDTLSTMAGRLARLNVQLEVDQQQEISGATNGISLTKITNGLLDAIDPDKQVEKAKEIFSVDEPTEEQISKASEQLANDACAVFDDPNFRRTLIQIRQQLYQVIDTVSQDVLLSADFDEKKANDTVESFRDFMETNKDEILALQIIYNKPYDQRHLTYAMIKDLANAMKKPPFNLSTEVVWMAFEQLGKNTTKKRSPDLMLADIISLVRYGLGKDYELTPYRESVDRRFDEWLGKQKESGEQFTSEQLRWLAMIKEHIATSMQITVDDFDNVPFYDKGGVMKVYNLFGDRFNTILDELNEVLAA
jgi:type I restriction enzyme, R subunit